jgi:hypothetical protein
MQSSKIQAAALAAFFGIAATGSLLTASARLAGTNASLANGAPRAALADDEHKHGDEGDQDDENDNGKHKHKHHRNGNSMYGTVRNINGNLLNVQLQNGQYLTVNDQNALNAGQANGISVGEYVRFYGNYAKNGQFYATRVIDANANNNGYPNGNNYPGGSNYPNGQNNCNTSGYNQAAESITGYQTGAPDSNGRFQIVTQQNGIPLPGQTYTIVTSNQTCFTTQLGGLGKRLTVVGFPSGDGRTIKALRISG